jgi:hypothetical protein
MDQSRFGVLGGDVDGRQPRVLLWRRLLDSLMSELTRVTLRLCRSCQPRRETQLSLSTQSLIAVGMITGHCAWDRAPVITVHWRRYGGTRTSDGTAENARLALEAESIQQTGVGSRRSS